MTDMRATERLLEVIEESASQIEWIEENNRDSVALGRHVRAIIDANIELRRRGDTLVRAEDLRMVVEVAPHGPVMQSEIESFRAALDRLENALGGKMRP